MGVHPAASCLGRFRGVVLLEAMYVGPFIEKTGFVDNNVKELA
jgi:hypothetical protein